MLFPIIFTCLIYKALCALCVKKMQINYCQIKKF